jgi:hypothetical protein
MYDDCIECYNIGYAGIKAYWNWLRDLDSSNGFDKGPNIDELAKTCSVPEELIKECMDFTSKLE